VARKQRYVHLAVLNKANGMVQPDNACFQFVVNNPTALVVKLGQKTVITTDYEYIAKAQCIYVSPCFNFTELSFVLDSFATGLYVLPMIYCYDRWVGTPGTYPLT